ncbi:MAG: LysM peptidoglycan-binding domain-containing protein, partial [Nitrospirales bacterium]|nr:LysM peptidoglycan-binding domain-containing protein [Nitrospirales bacterium]
FSVLFCFLASAVHATTTYTVKRGDTLYRIARHFNIPLSDLKEANSLKTGRLNAGTKLLIPGPGSSGYYTVRRGDSLGKIAKRFKMSADELRAINSLPDMTIKPGQKLLLSKKSSEEKEEEKTLPLSFDRKFSPVIASAKIEEVKDMAKSEDILAELSIKERLILFAKKMLHLPYQFGGNGTLGLDCSGYVQKVYGFIGQGLPRSAREQFHVGETVHREQLSTGDLVFFRTYAAFPSHVGIYIGNNLFIHASSLSKKITIDSLESPYFLKRYIGARRLLPEEKRATEAEELSVSVKEN